MAVVDRILDEMEDARENISSALDYEVLKFLAPTIEEERSCQEY